MCILVILKAGIHKGTANRPLAGLLKSGRHQARSQWLEPSWLLKSRDPRSAWGIAGKALRMLPPSPWDPLIASGAWP